MQKPIGRYVICKVGLYWLVCYAHKPDYVVSEHLSAGEARAAAKARAAKDAIASKQAWIGDVFVGTD
jgi:hypothetical protein